MEINIQQTQKKKILHYLQTGASLTALDALSLFNCWSLAQRIANLRDEGHAIQTTMIQQGRKRFASYKLQNSINND